MTGRRNILISDGKLLLAHTVSGLGLPEGDFGGYRSTASFHIGEDIEAFGVDASCAMQCNLAAVGLRESHALLPADDYAAAVKGAELIFWDGQTQYCGRCGAALKRETEISKRCPECKAEYFPHVSPAVIVLIRRGEEALLVHARSFSRPDMFGLVAGFVETGEDFEQTVKREVMEETSLEICNVRYAGSQAWPFPSTVMVGFTADYLSGELKYADGELSQGGFFSVDNLPELPSPPSIARRLIDRWVDEVRQSRRQASAGH